MSVTGLVRTSGSLHASGKRSGSRARWTRKTKVVSAVAGALLAGGGAYAATNWAVGLAGGSSGEAQSATVSNLTISAVATPAAANVMYPGGNGDAVVCGVTAYRETGVALITARPKYTYASRWTRGEE